jgi:hypothetical protein
MQVMPATARWTARKIGLTDFTPGQITDRDTNIAIGTGYLRLVLDDFAGSLPLAAAAYNAGPSRPRAWRNGPILEAAIWAENVPFAETRDYVKKVLSNTTNCAWGARTQKTRNCPERAGAKPCNESWSWAAPALSAAMCARSSRGCNAASPCPPGTTTTASLS